MAAAAAAVVDATITMNLEIPAADVVGKMKTTIPSVVITVVADVMTKTIQMIAAGTTVTTAASNQAPVERPA